MKRILTSLLVILLILCFSACGPARVVYPDVDTSSIFSSTENSTQDQPATEDIPEAPVTEKQHISITASALSQSFTSYGGASDEDYIFVKENYHDKITNKTMHLYSLYDALMAQYPEYITRTQIATTAEPTLPVYSSNDGKTVNESITADTTFPVYRYDFCPPVSPKTADSAKIHGQTVELPKILYTGGIHGGEYQQVYAAYRFFKMLCESWGEDSLLSELRWNVHFVVVPLTNPFGFNFPSGRYNAEGINVSKLNERNIDISGNFPSENYESGENDKYGFTPLSEPESQAIYKIIQEEDFILSIDNHTFGYLSTEYSASSGYKHMGGYFISSQSEPTGIDFWFMIGRSLNQRIRTLSPEIDSTSLVHSDGTEYSYANQDLFEIWTDSRDQMLCNTFRGVAANIEMTLSIDPENTLSDDEATPHMPQETQAFLVDELAVIFYEALQNLN